MFRDCRNCGQAAELHAVPALRKACGLLLNPCRAANEAILGSPEVEIKGDD